MKSKTPGPIMAQLSFDCFSHYVITFTGNYLYCCFEKVVNKIKIFIPLFILLKIVEVEI